MRMRVDENWPITEVSQNQATQMDIPRSFCIAQKKLIGQRYRMLWPGEIDNRMVLYLEIKGHNSPSPAWDRGDWKVMVDWWDIIAEGWCWGSLMFCLRFQLRSWISGRLNCPFEPSWIIPELSSYRAEWFFSTAAHCPELLLYHAE